MKKKVLLIVGFMLCSVFLFAQHRSEQEAMQIAQEFFAKKQTTRPMRLAAVPQAKVRAKILQNMAKAKASSSAKHNSCYIVNDEANNRFVIISADKRMYKILGYSDNGVFDAETAPAALLDLIDDYNLQFNIVEEYGDNLKATPQHAQSQLIAPLIKANWGQDEPYNLQCPEASDGSQSVTGCVATAMAMVMNHYHYPNSGMGGSVSYSTRSTGTYQYFNFNTLSLDWSKILNEYDVNSTYEQKEEVAKLMHACGVSVFMDYNKESGAYSEDIAYAMIHNFGYNPNIHFLKKSYYKSDDWDSTIMEELMAGRPILYGGQGTGGHQFVLDGADGNGLYHFNFGWDGTCNGYFSVDAINPVVGIELGGTFYPFVEYNFNSKQTMVTYTDIGRHI